MECPYCHKATKKGFITGNSFPALKWIEEARDKGPMIAPFQKGLKLTDPWISNQLETYYCEGCKKMIIDVKDELD